MPSSLLERAVKQAGAAKVFGTLTVDERKLLPYDWKAWARDNQLPPPGDWSLWLMLTGRGFGKSRSAAEFIRAEVEAGRMSRVALIGRTPADVRDTMLEGESGLLSISPPWFKPTWNPSNRRVTWPNGATASTFSSFKPDELRGPQFDGAWGDEIRTWYNAKDTWANLMFGLRLGQHPRAIATTTPLPTVLIKSLLALPTTVVTRGTSYENRANLAPSWFAKNIAPYEHTRLGRQEIQGELLEDVPGALWKRAWIRIKAAPDLQRVVVAIDPAVTSSENSDETGIIVAGKGVDGEYYILADRSCRLSPDGWARRAVQAYRDFKADKIIGEVNNGGEMVGLTIRTVDANINYKAVHASRGKVSRAEPIAALYEQGKVSHLTAFPELEEQMTTWLPESGYSPDRLDAVVWAMTELSQPAEVDPKPDIYVYDSMKLVDLEI